MAKKKSKGKKKKKAGASSEGVDDSGAALAEGTDDGQSDEEDSDEEGASPAGDSPASSRDPGAIVDSNIPRPDGRRSDRGGLIFVMVILGLLCLAVAAQFLIGS